jgi:hypothetical protein
VAAGLAAWGVVAGCAAPATPPPTVDPLASLQVTPTVGAINLVATGAFADFGVNAGGAHQVRVRIVDSLDFGLRIATASDLTLAESPVVCLVGPYSAPDDAGLESPCWGEPDLSEVLMSRLSRDSAGHYVLAGGQPVDIDVGLKRGTARCDYPPGTWALELKLSPVVNGYPTGARYVADTPMQVPITQTGPLALLPTTETRYCGLATAVVQQQGEPEVVEP